MSADGSRPAPTSTYRVQLRAAWGFAELAQQVDYLASLGVSHVYLSPILQAAPGSTHGYDVVDHSQLNTELGGSEGFTELRARLGEAGLGAVADVVPNHMAVPTPAYLNAALWSVLREGPTSAYAGWFDVDWAAQDRALLMPVLGRRIGECLADGEITLDDSGTEPVLRYYAHVLPVREGTRDLPLAQLLDRQFYRLAHWRVADEELNYRRFFDIDTLAALRVEDEAVFAESHALLAAMVDEGALDGLRIDHPDGLADPAQYLERLARATNGAWVVVEKILEGEEQLPDDWQCAGTTGYESLLRIGGLLLDPAGEHGLTSLYTELTGDVPDFPAVVAQAKREVVEGGLYTEVTRLVELAAAICHEDILIRDHTRRGLRESLVALLVAFPVYRTYLRPGEDASPEAVRIVEDAAEQARASLPEDRHPTLELVRDLALGRPVGQGIRDRRRDEFVVRFQQTCGPVMAKGVEDTAFYRWFRLSSLNEVGGDPAHFGVDVASFHRDCERAQQRHPLRMTTLSTHDTKRSEDVRARLGVLSEVPEEWRAAVLRWREASAPLRDSLLDPTTEYLVWQTLVGTWDDVPMGADRLVGYLEKATREAKRHTSWTDPDEGYDKAVRSFAEGVLRHSPVLEDIAQFCRRIAPAARVNVLTQKLVQLTMPGVPDVYQGTEIVDLSLVDPDNRRPVDYDFRRRLLAGIDEARSGGLEAEPARGLDQEKLVVVSRALRLRRDHRDWFDARGAYEPVTVDSAHAVAFCRGGSAVTVAGRLFASAGEKWTGAAHLPNGPWTDVLTGRAIDGGPAPLAELFEQLPVALLARPL